MINDIEDTSDTDLKNGKKRVAKKLAEQLIKDCHIDTPPVLINTIVQHLHKTLGYQIYCRSSELSDKFSGQIAKSGKTVGIMYNKNHHQVRQRFTVAHEIGHLMLEHGIVISDYKEVIDFKTQSPIEVEANIFGAELIMPGFILRKYLKKKYTESVKKLSEVFNVSEEAMWYKVVEDKLIKYVG